MTEQEKEIIEQIRVVSLAGKIIIGAIGSVLGSAITIAVQRVHHYIRRRHIRAFQRMETQASFASENQYLFSLRREIEGIELIYKCTDRSFEASILLTCFVDPFWFKDKDVRARTDTLTRYEKTYQNCDTNIEILRIVILSKRKARRFKKRLQASKSRGQDIIKWFTTEINTFPCYWACEERVWKFYKSLRPSQQPLLEDYALFRRNYLVMYDFKRRILVSGGHTELANRGKIVFGAENEHGAKGKLPICVFGTFEKMYKNDVKDSVLMLIMETLKRVLR